MARSFSSLSLHVASAAGALVLMLVPFACAQGFSGTNGLSGTATGSTSTGPINGASTTVSGSGVGGATEGSTSSTSGVGGAGGATASTGSAVGGAGGSAATNSTANSTGVGGSGTGTGSPTGSTTGAGGSGSGTGSPTASSSASSSASGSGGDDSMCDVGGASPDNCSTCIGCAECDPSPDGCEGAYNNCENDSDCSNILECFAFDGFFGCTSAECIAALELCEADNSDGMPAFNALNSCLSTACSSTCGN